MALVNIDFDVRRDHAEVPAGAAVGYVLGARAGHDRYEQLVRTYQRVSDHPAVQGASSVVRARVDEKLRGGQRTAVSSNGHRT